MVAAFNWSEKDFKTIEIAPARLGLGDGPWLVADARAGVIMNRGDGWVCLKLAPASCSLLIWLPLADHPQLISTNRHVTQGAIDLQRLAWNPARLELSGSSQVVGRDDYRVLFTVPAGWVVASAGVPVDRGVGVLTLRSEANRTMDWKVKFRRRIRK